jgi:hypothetical protein
MSTLTRRDALLAFGAAATTVVAVAVAAGPAAASSARSMPSPPAGGDRPWLLLDDSVAREDEHAAGRWGAAVATDAVVVGLQAELVRQWRDDLGARLSPAGMRAVAVTRWDKALLLQGLAREACIRTTTTRIGAGLFRTELTA